MKRRKLMIAAALVGLLGLVAWFAWDRLTTPAPPHIPLQGVGPEVSEAIEKAVQGVRRRPRSGEAWGELSMVLVANGFNEQALPCLAQASRFDPKHPRWPYLSGSVSLLLSRPREGIPKLREALRLARVSEERQATLFLLAQALVEDGQLDEAEGHLQTLHELQGESAQIHFGFGLLAVAREDPARARDHLTPLTSHPCARRQVCSLLARLTEDDEKLAASYRERVAEFPADLPWPNSFDTAVRQYRVSSTQPLDRYNEFIAAGRREEGVAFLRQVVARSPDEQVCFALGFALIRMAEFVEAEKVLRQVLQLNPQHLKAHLFLGAALLEQGEKRFQEPGSKEEALELFRQAVLTEDKALSLQSDLALAHLLRGRALKRLGRTDEALACLRGAVLEGPDLSEAHQALGELLAETGQMQEAMEHLEDAVRVAPSEDPRPRQALEKWRAKAKARP